MKKSFTLIEILIAVFIFSVVMVTATATMSNALSSQAKTGATREITQAVQDAMETIAKDIRGAQTIEFYTLPNTCSAFSDKVLIIKRGDNNYVCYCADKAMRLEKSSNCGGSDFTDAANNLFDPNSIMLNSLTFSVNSSVATDLSKSQQVNITLVLSQPAAKVRETEKASIRLDTSVMKMRY